MGGTGQRPLRVSAALILRDGKLLICQRAARDAFPLKWEFPGGKVEEGEEPASALARELQEELGIRVTVGAEVARIRHAYPGGPEVELFFFSIPTFAGEPVNRGFAAVKWASLATLPGYDFLEADRPLVTRMAREGRLPGAP
ncbi:MAG: (deoxy)nucleoside triphosphate pyrophosphohydrolase [Candidatus Methylomirabilales bacterium]